MIDPEEEYKFAKKSVANAMQDNSLDIAIAKALEEDTPKADESLKIESVKKNGAGN